MHIKESMNAIVCAEKKYSVNSWMIAGIHVWPIIRNQLGLALCRVENGSDSELKMVARLSKLISFPVSIARSVLGRIASNNHDSQIKENASIADVLFLKLSQDRLMKTPQGLMYDIHCDPIQDMFVPRKMKTQSFEWSVNGYYILPRYSPSRIIQDEINRIKLLSVWRTSKKNASASFCEEYPIFVREIKTSFPSIELPPTHYIAAVTQFISRLSEYFSERINESRAKIGFVADYSSNIGMAFCLACRKSGIASIDIQHGVAGYLNCIYGQWTNIPNQGYELLPRFFWSWSEEDAEAINCWARDKDVADYHQAICGGNPLIDLWKRESDFLRHYDSIIDTYMPQGRKILVALQNGFGVPDLLVKAIRLSPAEWSWWIRYHPYSSNQEKSEIRSKLSQDTSQAKIEFEFTNSLPLMALLRNVDLCITPWSAVCLDAIALNTKVILVHEAGKELFGAQIECGLAVVALDIESLLGEIAISNSSPLTKRHCLDSNRAEQAIQYILETGKRKSPEAK